jgi:hypothetical protein
MKIEKQPRKESFAQIAVVFSSFILHPSSFILTLPLPK